MCTINVNHEKKIGRMKTLTSLYKSRDQSADLQTISSDQDERIEKIKHYERRETLSWFSEFTKGEP